MKIETATIRIKLIGALLISVAMAGMCMLGLCIIMIMASVSMQFAIFFNQHILEFIILFLVIFSVLTVIFFLMLVRRRIQYLEEITKILDKISEGNLDIYIPVNTTDELGNMAQAVNDMAHKLKVTIEEERRLEKSKNDLITNISHDLRTPLTSTLGYLELITHMGCNDEEKLKRYSSIAYNQCKDLKLMIDELFEFSKLSNPGMAINKARVSIGELLEQVILGFIPVFKKEDMEYSLHFINEKLMVHADPLLLTRVFENLINNAIKYGKEGKYVDVELDRENDQAVIRIINYGSPIPDTDLPYVFERFYQTDQSRSKQSGGSGLGLAIAKSIIGLHNGSIRASSLDNRTIFEVKLKLE